MKPPRLRAARKARAVAPRERSPRGRMTPSSEGSGAWRLAEARNPRRVVARANAPARSVQSAFDQTAPRNFPKPGCRKVIGASRSSCGRRPAILNRLKWSPHRRGRRAGPGRAPLPVALGHPAGTVAGHLQSAQRKLGLASRIELIRSFAFLQGADAMRE